MNSYKDKQNKTLHYPYVHTTLMVNRDSSLTLIHEITYTFNNLIEFKPNFYNIKNSTTTWLNPFQKLYTYD